MRGETACDLTEAGIRDIAVRYLTRREYGVEELRQKLVQRGGDAGVVDTVVSALVDENLLSDQRFTEMYVRTRARRLFGPLKIRGELRGLGIADYLIEEAMPSDQGAWLDAASQWAGKKCRGELDYAARAKLYRSLMNRGFTHEQANTALDTLNSSD